MIGCGGLPRVLLRLPWAMNFCLFEAYPSDRMSSPVMWHTTSSYFPHAKNPWRSAAPTAHQKPSSRQRSKSKESVKRPIRAHRKSVFLIKAARTATQHLTCHIQHSTFHIQHPTLHTQHSTSNTPQSQHPSPKSTLFFLSSTALRSNTPFSHIFATV